MFGFTPAKVLIVRLVGRLDLYQGKPADHDTPGRQIQFVQRRGRENNGGLVMTQKMVTVSSLDIVRIEVFGEGRAHTISALQPTKGTT